MGQHDDHAGHDHSHEGHGHSHGRGADRRRLTVALVITATFMIAEIIGGIAANSLALLADAGHMASDVAALALSLFAIWFASRPATPERTYGFFRVEILAAFVNAATLLLVTAFIFVEAYERLSDPPEVQGALMLWVAGAGLVANLISAWVLMGGQQNLNVRGAFLHVIGDLLGSVGAIVAAVVVLTTGFTLADPILSAVIGLLVLRSAWGLLMDSLNVLLEGAPRGMNVREVRAAIQGVPGVLDVHDLHVWSITAEQPVLTAHVEIQPAADATTVLVQARETLAQRYGLKHVTLQLEAQGQVCEVREDLHE